MKRYRLTKDLPTFKTGQLAYVSKTGNLMAGTPEKQKTTETGLIIMIYHETTLKKFPNILTEWFEEIQESTDSIHWKPKNGEIYWFTGIGGKTNHDFWTGTPADFWRYGLGKIYRTKEECEKARDRELAEARLRRTSTFKPDFENGDSGWGVHYDHLNNKLGYFKCSWQDTGEPIRYKTSQEAEKSIKENRDDWLTYFGIEEEQ